MVINAYEKVRMMGAALPVDQTLNSQQCPFCNADDKAFSITRVADGLLYMCFRDSCRDGRGKVYDSSRPDLDFVAALEPSRRGMQDYHGPLHILDSEQLAYFRKRFFVNNTFASNHIRAGYPGQYVFPIADLIGSHIGYSVRRIAWDTGGDDGPKTINYVVEGEPRAAWYGKGDKLVVVEDCLSALRVAQDVPTARGLALLGTYLSDDTINQVARGYFPQAVVMLDPAAEATAIKIAARLRPHVGAVSVHFGVRDPKDMTNDELRLALQ